MIDPYTCEIINECLLDRDLVEKYSTHIDELSVSLKTKIPFAKIFLNNFGIIGDAFEFIITFGACILFVVSTYMSDDYPDEFQMIDLVVASIFLID